MKKMMISVLKNKALNEYEEYDVMVIGSDILKKSIDGDGTDNLKVLLKKTIKEFINDANWNPYVKDVDFCVSELAKGHASNIDAEDFWWEEKEIFVNTKVWVMTQESCVDGEVHFNVVVCDSEETAKAQMQKEIDWIKNESFHFRDFEERGDDFEVEQGEHRFFINDETDDYYEEIMVMEKEITTL